jgi:PAS domain S-box-containing protein
MEDAAGVRQNGFIDGRARFASGSARISPVTTTGETAGFATRHLVLEALLESATDDAIFATDLDGRVTTWNHGATDMLGWTEADMLGQPADRLFTTEDRAAGVPQAEMAAALRDGRGQDERWHQRRDGTRFWAGGEILALRDPTGRTAGFLKILRDRTGQRRALEAQRADAEFLRRVLAASADCIKVLDLDGRLLFMNEGGLRLMEAADPPVYAGLVWPDLWEGEAKAAAWAAVTDARSGGIGRFKQPGRTFGGTLKWWDVIVTPMLGADEKPDRLLAVSRDVSAAREAEQRLAQSEERLSLALSAPGVIGIWDWDVAAGKVYADAKAAPLYGFDAAAGAAGIPPFDFIRNIHSDDLPAFRAELLRVIAAGAVFSHEYRVVQADARARWVLATGRPILGPAGQVVRFPGTVVDTTDRKRSEIRRIALMEMGDRVRDLDDPREMAYAGAAAMARALELTRAAYGEVDSARETILIERDWTAPAISSLAGAYWFRDYGSYIDDLKAGRAVVIEDTAHDPRTQAAAAAWEALDVRSLINLPIFEQGKFVALFLVQRSRPGVWPPEEIDFIRNVADRIRVAVERANAERRLRELAASLERQVADRTRERDRAWQVSRDLLGVADESGLWQSVNPAWTAILGWDAGDLIGRTLGWLRHPDNAPQHAAVMAIPVGGSLNFEGRYRGRDGLYRWIAWTMVRDDREIYCVGRDISAEKDQAAALADTEAQLRQAQKMEAVGQLTGGIAHDFNNLLAGIVGSLEMMQTRIGQGRVAEAARFVNAAQGAAQRAAALTHRLLAFSRRQTLDPKPTALNRLIDGMEDLIRRSVGPPIIVDIAGDERLWVTFCDPNQLENALLNLCINARDAMPDGGRLTIETANASLDPAAARLRELPPGDYVVLRVTDTGTGMPPDVVEHVFEPFFTTKPIGQGTGLGLSMVYGFAKQSGGQVRILSVPGEGTTVKLYLPRHRGRAETVDERDAGETVLAGAAGHHTVLVVDDEPSVLMLVTEVLRDLGFTPLEAADGPAALHILQSDRRLDLMVTDVGLPGGMNGRQLADVARQTRANLPVLLITGYAEHAALGQGDVAPGMQVMTKPFAIEALAAKIKSMIS